MTEEKIKIALFGIGFFEKELLRVLSTRYHVIAVDMNESLVKALAEELPAVECLAGDASSILTWKKIDPSQLTHVISSIHDTDVNREICRIVRETYQLDIPITFIAPALRDEQKLQKYNAAILSPVDIGINAVLNRLEKNYTKAGDIGLKKGEFIEVPILARS
ncbi:MAG: NAD-binding protein, partial [Deltaproteobacteria bacterium]|nr:NAD-binding protein [Deltaproteobacteria bacterium]